MTISTENFEEQLVDEKVRETYHLLRNDPSMAAELFSPLRDRKMDPAKLDRIMRERRFLRIVAGEAWSDS
jgi:hypothetical protein